MIRFARVEDVKELLEIYRPYVENTAITFEYETPSIEEFTSRMLTIQKKYPYLVYEKNHEIVGYAYANTFKPRAAYDWCVEVTIYLKEDYKGQGIGKLLYTKLEDVLRDMGFTNMCACITYTDVEDEYLKNDSMRFHSKMGYSLVGQFHNCGYKFNRWYHMIWMEKMINEHTLTMNCTKNINEVEV